MLADPQTLPQVDLGLTDYACCVSRMRQHVQDPLAEDQLWLTQHHSVYTCGPRTQDTEATWHDVPVVRTDRGGLMTYHGPGQLIFYPLLHLKRWHLGPKTWVELLEQTTLATLADWGLKAEANTVGHGVYVQGMKIASLGIRIKRGWSYHGLALNVAMDLAPFKHITPCGLHDITMVDMQHWEPNIALADVQARWCMHLAQQLGYNLAKA